MSPPALRRQPADASLCQASPEGGQAAGLLQYGALVVVARLLEVVTGTTGILTLCYLGIAASSLLHWLRGGLPSPAEARARVEALEAGLPYVGAPDAAAQAAFAAACPAAVVPLVHESRASVAGFSGRLFLTRATLVFAATNASCTSWPLSAMLAVEDSAVGTVVLRLRDGTAVEVCPLPPSSPPPTWPRPVPLAKLLSAYVAKASEAGRLAGA